MAQQQVLEDEVLARANRGKEGGEQEPEEFEHVLSIVDQAVRGFATPQAALLGRALTSYTAGSMTYDLRRLRLHGVIRRAPRTLRYTLTANGMHAAFLYATLYRRLRQPRASVGAHPHFSSRIDAALHQLDAALQELWSSTQRPA